MSNNFLEINNATFVASKINKVIDFNLNIKNESQLFVRIYTNKMILNQKAIQARVKS